MTPAITLEELLIWCQESADFWKSHLEANPDLLGIPCGIGGTADVQAFVRHIWGAELVWSQRLGGLPTRDRNDWPVGPLEALFALHLEALENFRALLANPSVRWDERTELDYPWMAPAARRPTPRKLLAHVLIHGQRHWAQLATLLRVAGFPTKFLGDLLPSWALV